MKKYFITGILICIFLISFLATNVLAVTVAEDSFRKSLTNTIDPVNSLVKMDTENDIITIVASNGKIKYDFSGNPKFTIDLDFNKNMTEEECIKEFKEFYGLVNMFPVVADHFSIDDNQAQTYFIGKMNENEKIKKIPTRSIENYTNAINFAKEMFDTDINLSDNLFSIKSNKVSETADTYKAQITLTVDLNGDFSKLKDDALEYEKEQSDAILNAAQNAANKYQETLKKEEEALNKYQNNTSSSTGSTILDAAQNALDQYKDGGADEEADKLKDFEDSLLNNTTNKNDNTQKEENKTDKDTTNKEENKVENTNKEENVNVQNNVPDTSTETIGATSTENNSSNVIDVKTALFVACGVLTVILIFVIYKIFALSKVEK